MNETLKIRLNPKISSRISWLDIAKLKVRYFTFLLWKCLRKNNFSYLNFIVKMNLALMVSRFPLMKHQKFTSLSFLPERIRILLETYIFFRIDDDRADWEFDTHMSPTDRVRYIMSRLEACRTWSWSTDKDINMIMTRVMRLAQKLGIEKELRDCFLKIFESLAFDARRMNEFECNNVLTFFPQETLIENYFRMDSLGTGAAMMYIFWDRPEDIPPETIQQCTTCSDAVRMSYTIRDFLEDIRAGIVNIPLEEAQIYGITVEHIYQAMKCESLTDIPTEISVWCRDQLQIAKELFWEGIQAAQDQSWLWELSRKVLGSSYSHDFWRDIWRSEEQLWIRDGLPSLSQWMQYLWGLRDGYIQLLWLLWKYSVQLKMNIFEQKKIFTKSHHLFLMYRGFSDINTQETSWWAVRSAFLSATYDWITDGPKKSPQLQQKFLKILREIAPHNSMNAKIEEMVYRDVDWELQDDGLERGTISFVSVLEEMGVLSIYQARWLNLEEIGAMLQIIDDIDDFEKDTVAWDWNALNTPRKQEYVHRMEQYFYDNWATIFPGENARFLRWFIAKMRDKIRWWATVG